MKENTNWIYAVIFVIILTIIIVLLTKSSKQYVSKQTPGNFLRFCACYNFNADKTCNNQVQKIVVNDNGTINPITAVDNVGDFYYSGSNLTYNFNHQNFVIIKTPDQQHSTTVNIPLTSSGHWACSNIPFTINNTQYSIALNPCNGDPNCCYPGC